MSGARAQRDIAWERGAEVPALDPHEWRVDHFCRLMRYDDFDRRDSGFGWTVAELEADQMDEAGIAGRIACPVAFSTLDEGGGL